jgi:mono/diheme cytochrome c family protein
LVTEIPEHLLRRSRERRAALSGGDEATTESATSETATAEAAAVTAESPRSAAPVVAASGAPATRTGGAGGAGPTAATPAPAEVPDQPRIGPTRTKIPLWVMPVLAALPLWGIVYLGAFGPRQKASANDPLTLGGQLFAANCSSCHGANGEGGVGPKLSGGEVVKTWPKVADHIAWVHTGGAPFVGKTYGAQGHSVPANNIMPAFQGTLSDTQIIQVVCYERVALGNEAETPTNCPGSGGA